MFDEHRFESLILTNTIVVVFCIILLVTFTVFIILFLVPSFRRRCFNKKENDEKTFTDHLTLSPSRLNPLFESTTSTTTTTTQFGTSFHPHATTATLLHPTIWTSISPSTSQ